MTETLGSEPQYEFDVAVSFAGHNRKLVEEVVRAVGDDIRVFYDEDHLVEMWGENLVEYFTDLYQHRAKYAVIFISSHYADSLWTILERQSALARAMTQRSAYVLPIRLDETELPGLLPTVSYLEANRLGVDGLASAIRKKVGVAVAATTPPYHGGVATTPDELQELIGQKTPGWEYVLYASVLNQTRDALVEQRRDHEIGYAAPNGKRITTLEELRLTYQGVLHDLSQTAESFNKVLDSQAFRMALGEPDVPGDPDRILHLGKRFMDVYERFLNIAADLNGTTVADEYRHALELVSSIVNRPLQDLDKFIDHFVPLINGMPERLKSGENVEMTLVVELALDSEVMDAVSTEIARLFEVSDH